MDILDQNLPPYKQAAMVAAGALVLMGGGWLLSAIGMLEMEPLFPWSIATAFSLLFAIFNSLMSLKAPNPMKYWGISMYSYLGLALVNGTAAWLISGIPLREAGTYRWIYIVVTFGFLVFLSLVNFVRRIVEFAEREEWTQPRKRQR
ncbi:MAG: hypothetical protein JNL02_02855 [Saprospiraceae bacterium]|nr:hypothetical protein [Saprospiraceae bacterium]